MVVGEGVVNSPGRDGGCNNSATDRGSGSAGDEKSAAGEAFIPATVGPPPPVRSRRPGSVQGRRRTGLGRQLLPGIIMVNSC